jgi:hypothetical protein
MNELEAQAIMNPGICPVCEGNLVIKKSTSLLSDYFVECTKCSSKWTSRNDFFDRMDVSAVASIRAEGVLHPYPFEVSLIMGKGEFPLHTLPNVGIYEGRKYEYKSSSAGMSLRLAPGIWIRSGSSSGSGSSEEILKKLDVGNFIVTNKRVAFIGSKHNVTFSLADILSLNIDGGLLYIARANKKRIESFSMIMPNYTKELILMAAENKMTTEQVDMGVVPEFNTQVNNQDSSIKQVAIPTDNNSNQNSVLKPTTTKKTSSLISFKTLLFFIMLIGTWYIIHPTDLLTVILLIIIDLIIWSIGVQMAGL